MTYRSLRYYGRMESMKENYNKKDNKDDKSKGNKKDKKNKKNKKNKKSKKSKNKMDKKVKRGRRRITMSSASSPAARPAPLVPAHDSTSDRILFCVLRLLPFRARPLVPRGAPRPALVPDR